jgi:hypothetical protein
MSVQSDKSNKEPKRVLSASTASDRQALERKVDEGTKKAVEEYGEVFERLAEYDRT